jgi:hypothetical protein
MNPLKLANPVTVLKGAVGLAGMAIGLAGTVTRGILEVAIAGLDRLEEAGRQNTGSEPAEPTGPAFAGPLSAVTPVSHLTDGPPVDVVGKTLAAEAAAERGDAPDGQDLAHEPRGASRDEEHGDTGLQPAEVEEIAEETAATLEGEVEPEERLPPPLLDPADTKAAASELRTMERAADPQPE